MRVPDYGFENIDIFVSALQPVDSRMYTLLCGNSALLVDAVEDDSITELLRKAGVQFLTIVLTHEHHDHISGVNYLRKHFDSSVICTKECAVALPDPRHNLSKYYSLVISAHFGENVPIMKTELYSCSADIWFVNSMRFTFSGYDAFLYATPGHSPGSLCMTLDGIIFTGDSLIPGKRIVTALPGGDREAFERETRPFIKSLPKDMLVFPGHGEPQRLGDILYGHPDFICL